MRVTSQAKSATRRKILGACRRLFRRNGYGPTTTRDIAEAAGIAAGTLFNYFPTKEAAAMTLVADALDAAAAEFAGERRDDEALDELLFAYIATGLRHLGGCRVFLAEVAETTLGPFAAARSCPQADMIRAAHLETVYTLISERAATTGARRATPADLHLYWSLYLAVLAFWSRDESENQQATLAFLDHAVRVFASSLNLPGNGAMAHESDTGGTAGSAASGN